MAHINPIKSKPLSPEGRENYDKIFRKQTDEEYDAQCRLINEIAGITSEMRAEWQQAWEDKKRDKVRELYREMAQKHLDESA